MPLTSMPRSSARKFNFNKATFGERVNFGGAQFGDHAGFMGAHFGNGAFLAKAKFSDHASFFQATFGDGANFSRAEFGNDAWFGSCEFGQRAYYGDAKFGDAAKFEDVQFGDRASFNRVKFGDRADFHNARLEGASFVGAWLAGTDFRRVRFDYRTSLEGARLFTYAVGDELRGRPAWLGDVRWNGVQISGVQDWSYAKRSPRLGEDPDLGATDSADSTELREAPLDEAVRAYRQVSVLLESQGLHEVAGNLDYRASQLARRQRGRSGRFGLWALDFFTGYGYRPMRVLWTYLATVVLFASAYWGSGTTTPQDALWVSVLTSTVVESFLLRRSW